MCSVSHTAKPIDTHNTDACLEELKANKRAYDEYFEFIFGHLELERPPIPSAEKALARSVSQLSSRQHSEVCEALLWPSATLSWMCQSSQREEGGSPMQESLAKHNRNEHRRRVWSAHRDMQEKLAQM
jgi:hypothetical protein